MKKCCVCQNPAMCILEWGGHHTQSREPLCREHMRETCEKISNQVKLGIMWYTIKNITPKAP